jgi:hypothetical protein
VSSPVKESVVASAINSVCIDVIRSAARSPRPSSPPERITAAAREGPVGLCITGAPGCGKSALVGEAARRLKESGTFLLLSKLEPTSDRLIRRNASQVGEQFHGYASQVDSGCT